jgi:hypothetical protein
VCIHKNTPHTIVMLLFSTHFVLVLLAEFAQREQTVVHGEGVVGVERLEDAVCLCIHVCVL